MRFIQCRRLAAGLLLCGLSGVAARAQTVPVAGVAGPGLAPQVNPGTLRLGQERQRLQLERQHQTPLQPPDDPLTGPEVSPGKHALPGQGPTFKLAGVTFDPSTLLTPSQLAAVAARFVGKVVDFSELDRLVAAVNALYEERGAVTANASLPPQRIHLGVVHVALVEGRVGRAILDGNKHTNDAYLLNRVAVRPGEILDGRRLSSELTYFNRTNDVNLRALLVPGASFGQTDIRLAVEEPKINVLDVFADNQGGDTTNRYEAGLLFQRTGLLGRDDRLTFYGTASQGSLTGSASYTVPVDVWGDRVGVSYQRNRIHVVAGAFESLRVTGGSATADVSFSHPFVATRAWLLTGTATLADVTSNTRQVGESISDDETRKGTFALAASHYGEDSTVTLIQGASYGRNRSAVLRASQSVLTFNGSASGFLRLSDRNSLVSQAAWQYAPQKRLPADQLFEIGGPTTVRGYPSSGLAGNDGFYVSVEAHRNFAVAQGADAFAYLDRGTILAPLPKPLSLQTIGVGGSVNFLSRFTASLTAAIPVLDAVHGQRGVRVYARLVAHVF